MRVKTVLILLFALLAPGVLHAESATSITVDARNFNLSVFSKEEHAPILKVFNDVLRREMRLEQVHDCGFVIDLPVGVAQGNHSYGGYCQSADGKDSQMFMICTDMLIGLFKLQPLEENKMPDDGINVLAKFTADNCYGGIANKPSPK